jgi:hypothetical protein
VPRSRQARRISEAEERVNDAGLREPSFSSQRGDRRMVVDLMTGRMDAWMFVRLDVRLPAFWRCIGHMGQGQGASRLFRQMPFD